MMVFKMFAACALGSAFAGVWCASAGEATSDQAGKAEADQVKQLVAEARREYAALAAKFVSGEVEEIFGRLLDNGRPIDPKRQERVKAELKRDAEKTAAVITALAAAKVEPADFVVQQTTEHRFAVLDEKGAPVESRREASVTVTFSLKGSEEVRRTHLARGGGITLGRDDTLLVVMKKLGNTWYWNPFGW